MNGSLDLSRYDIRIRGAAIKPGDRVLVKVVSFDGKHKLAYRWEQDPYIVVGIPDVSYW
jgi:translation initiation factor IF-1